MTKKIGVVAGVVLAMLGVLLGLVVLCTNKSDAAETAAHCAESAVEKVTTRVRVNEVRIEEVKIDLTRFEKVQEKMDSKIDKVDGKLDEVLLRLPR